jgi:CheY-like chemotaxis protein
MSRASGEVEGLIVLVEDQELVRKLVKRVFEGEGYEVVDVADGQRCLDEIQRRGGGVSLLMADLSLPRGVSGLDVARMALEAQPELRVVCMSGYPEKMEEAIAELPDTGQVEFLTKPFTTGDLIAAVNRALCAAGALPRAFA